MLRCRCEQASTCTPSVAAPAGQRGYSLYFDQDLFVPGTNQDRDYTMGLGIEVFEDQGPLYLLGDVIDAIGPRSQSFNVPVAARSRHPATQNVNVAMNALRRRGNVSPHWQ